MKKVMIMMFCWTSTLLVFAQDTQTTPASSGTNEIHTLFNKGSGKCKIPLGYFIELNGGYTHFGHKSEFLPGMSMGLILNHHWTIGLTGSFVGNSNGAQFQRGHQDTTRMSKHGSGLNGGYGGLLVEYTLFPQSKVHVSFPLTIGTGSIYHSRNGHLSDSTDSQKKWYHHGEQFLVIEPGVRLEVNVIKKLRIGLGISYRYSPERDHLITSPDMLNQLTGKLSLRFGKF
jgi:hypothetical protein